jgi:hypothetical protein
MSDALSDAVADGDLFRFMGIDHQTRDDLQELAPLLERALLRLMDEFYTQMRNFPNLTGKFCREHGMSRARNTCGRRNRPQCRGRRRRHRRRLGENSGRQGHRLAHPEHRGPRFGCGAAAG